MVTPDTLAAMGNPAWAGNWTVQQGSVRSVNLVADLVVEVPCPARVVFLKDGSSFQGPVRLDRS